MIGKPVYIIYMQGVYIQDVCSVFTNIDDAKKEAIKLINKEEDDYHDFFIGEYHLNCPDFKPIEKFKISRDGKTVIVEKI